MEMKRVVKNVVALSSAAMFLGSTVLGALDLSNYPAPFTENGDFDGLIVVGADAATADVIGAIDIAASLQADTVEEKSVTVEGSVGSSVSVEGGMALRKDNKIVSPVTGGLFEVYDNLDDVDFPELLERKSIVEADANEEYKYNEELTFAGTYSISYGRPDTDLSDDPYYYVSLTEDANMWTYELSFDKTVDIRDFEDNEEIEIFGKSFFIDPDNSAGDTLKLYGGSEEISLEVGDVQTVEGKEIELIGANTDGSQVTLKIDGRLYTKTEGQSIAVGDENIYVKEVHIQTIPEDTAIVTLSVGSMELELDTALKMDGDTMDGYTVDLVGDNIETLDGIKIEYNPSETDLDVDYLLEGESHVDEVFDFEVRFDTVTPSLMDDAKTEVELSANSDTATLTFVNKDGVEIAMEVAEGSGTNTNFHEDFAVDETYIADGEYFILNEDTTEDATSYYLQADDVVEDDGAVYVKLKNEGYTDLEIRSGKEILDTEVYVVGTSTPATVNSKEYERDKIALVNSSLTEVSDDTTPVTDSQLFVYEDEDGNQFLFDVIANTTHWNMTMDGETVYSDQNSEKQVFGAVNITAATTDVDLVGDGELYTVEGLATSDDFVWTKYGVKLELVDDTDVILTLHEDEADQYADNFAGTLGSINVTMVADSDDVEFNDAVNDSGSWDLGVSDEDSDYEYGVSEYGTFYKQDVDDKTKITFWVPAKEQEAIVTVGRDVEVSLSGSSTDSTIEYEEVNKIGTGIAMLDSEVTSVAGKNIIAVGGYAANSVAAQFMSAEDLPEAFGEGQALVKLAENGDNVALVVAGYTADDTRLASQVLANYEDYDLSGETVVISGSSLSNVDVVTE